MIKFSNYLIEDWSIPYPGIAMRIIYNSINFQIIGSINIKNFNLLIDIEPPYPNNWEVSVSGVFSKEYYLIYPRYKFNNLDEAKNHADQFLDKLIKLKEFL